MGCRKRTNLKQFLSDRKFYKKLEPLLYEAVKASIKFSEVVLKRK